MKYSHLTKREGAKINKSLGLRSKVTGRFIKKHKYTVPVIIIGVIATVTTFSLIGDLTVYETSKVEAQEIDTRDHAQKVADQIAEFTRQIEQLERLQAEHRVQKEDVSKLLSTLDEEIQKNADILDEIRETRNTLFASLEGK